MIEVKHNDLYSHVFDMNASVNAVVSSTGCNIDK